MLAVSSAPPPGVFRGDGRSSSAEDAPLNPMLALDSMGMGGDIISRPPPVQQLIWLPPATGGALVQSDSEQSDLLILRKAVVPPKLKVFDSGRTALIYPCSGEKAATLFLSTQEISVLPPAPAHSAFVGPKVVPPPPMDSDTYEVPRLRSESPKADSPELEGPTLVRPSVDPPSAESTPSPAQPEPEQASPAQQEPAPSSTSATHNAEAKPDQQPAAEVKPQPRESEKKEEKKGCCVVS
jgi:hypothetical protein